jgi:hypothetical protein
MSISSSAVLASLNISVWPASKLDREVTDQVNSNANASINAGKFMKDLFAGTSLRKDIEKFAAHCRVKHLRYTLPWADKGERLLPTSLFMEYKQFINEANLKFDQLCDNFFIAYPQLLADAPLHLGSLYKADDYPTLEEVKNRFGFNYVISPLPEAGDFRLDVGNAELEELKHKYAADYDSRLADAMREPWERLHTVLTAMSVKLTDEPGQDDDDKPKKRYHETLVTNATDLCALLTKLNVTGDPKLEEARKQLELTMLGADIEAIKESPAIRESMKSKVDAILGKFNW